MPKPITPKINSNMLAMPSIVAVATNEPTVAIKIPATPPSNIIIQAQAGIRFQMFFGLVAGV